MSTELEYLRYVYSTLDSKQLIDAYKHFSGVPPAKYFLLLCKDCDEDLAQHICTSCSKPLCNNCLYVCNSLGLMLCRNHFMLCPLCQEGCVCPLCRKFSVEHTCTVCSENYEIAFSCGCSMPEDNSCMICDNRIHPITKERL